MSSEFQSAEPIGPSNEPDSPVVELERNGRCTYNGQWYNNGATICRGGKKHQCVDGSWVKLGESC